MEGWGEKYNMIMVDVLYKYIRSLETRLGIPVSESPIPETVVTADANVQSTRYQDDLKPLGAVDHHDSKQPMSDTQILQEVFRDADRKNE